jgi:hypothetical protein
MAEAELWELIAVHAANAMSAFNIYLTVTFAYLIAAYLVGAKLSKLQTGLITGLFIFSAGSGWLAMVIYLRRAAIFQDMLASESEIYARTFLMGGKFWSVYMAILLAFGMAVSLYFMYDIRRKGQ